MASYIASNNERLYAAIESTTGHAAGISAANRLPVVRFSANQQTEQLVRRDKTGSRTFRGLPFELRKVTTFEMRTYLASWTNTTRPPAYGPFVQSALGAVPILYGGGSVASGSSSDTIQTTASHGLRIGQGVSYGGEIRFVAAVPNATSLVLNQPFTTTLTGGAPLAPTVSYAPGAEVPSVSVYDYRTPSSALQKIVTGAGVDQMRVLINGDFHEFEFSGLARELVDSTSFESGSAGLTNFPTEPALEAFEYLIVPGHMGQAWLGSGDSRFYTVTSAEITVENGLDMREREFGGQSGGNLVAGDRRVSVSFSLFERDDEATRALYRASRQRTPISVMFQLGQMSRQLCGIWLKNVIPEVPQMDDSESRLQWRFESARAQGTGDDEIFVAFA